jgi:hypothetical protein
MTKYRVIVPFIHDMGSVAPLRVTSTPMESAAQAALWEINSMRDHDGLPHLKRLPQGCKFQRLED